MVIIALAWGLPVLVLLFLLARNWFWKTLAYHKYLESLEIRRAVGQRVEVLSKREFARRVIANPGVVPR